MGSLVDSNVAGLYRKNITTNVSVMLVLKQPIMTICGGWMGWAMVLGSFQCQGVLLLLHIVGQRVRDRLAILFIFFIYLPFLMSCLLEDG